MKRMTRLVLMLAMTATMSTAAFAQAAEDPRELRAGIDRHFDFGKLLVEPFQQRRQPVIAGVALRSEPDQPGRVSIQIADSFFRPPQLLKRPPPRGQ